MKTVVVVSGGMDSVTLLHEAKKRSEETQALSFDYGQRHRKELEYAESNCTKLSVPWRLVDMRSLTTLLSDSALTFGKDVPDGKYNEAVQKQTVVPNRNMIMASIAIGVAVNDKFDTVALGVHAGDHAIYPDCRPEFIAALGKIAYVANYQPIRIWTPYLRVGKGYIVRRGTELGVDFSLSWTCYKGESVPCGVCGSCTERAEAFESNGLKDPLYG